MEARARSSSLYFPLVVDRWEKYRGNKRRNKRRSLNDFISVHGDLVENRTPTRAVQSKPFPTVSYRCPARSLFLLAWLANAGWWKKVAIATSRGLARPGQQSQLGVPVFCLPLDFQGSCLFSEEVFLWSIDPPERRDDLHLQTPMVEGERDFVR